MKVVLLSVHDGASDRKTGFHFWMDILAQRGHDVRFITAGSSLVSLAKKNGKQLKKPFNQWVTLAPNAQKYTWMPLFHPFNAGRALDKILSPLFRLYPYLFPRHVLNDIKNADVFIIESGAAPLLMPILMRHAPNARYIYNPSDRFNVVKFHPLIVQGNLDALGSYDLIRLNAEAVASEFPPDIKTTYVPQAIDRSVFDGLHTSPYSSVKNAISVGDMLFDAKAIEILARAFPDWTFHVFGKKAKLEHSFENVIVYGEIAFNKLAAYIKFADIGLAPYENAPDIEYLSQSSLKFVQYTYCRLPIVAPSVARGKHAHILPYSSSDEPQSVIDAFEQAITYDRNSIDADSVPSWENVIDRMLALAEEEHGKRKS